MPRKALPQISEAEFKVMKIVWKYAPVSTVEITEYLRPSTHWSYNTVQTLLKRLLQKGALSYEKRSRVFVYTPLVAETDYIRQESRSFLDLSLIHISIIIGNDILSESVCIFFSSFFTESFRTYAFVS